MLYKIYIEGTRYLQLYKELIQQFLKPEEFLATDDPEVAAGWKKEARPGEDPWDLKVTEVAGDRNAVRRALYEALQEWTHNTQAWGILTGIRPVKLLGELQDIKGCSVAESEAVFRDKYYVSKEKTRLTEEILTRQRNSLGQAPENSTGIYVGIPFCPTRCSYCSFASNQVSESEMERYLSALVKEIEAVGTLLKERGYVPESVYVGGGTPTSLNAKQLAVMLGAMQEHFGPASTYKELTVEAGRPDTVTHEKLAVLKDFGVERISINPQSMKQETLDVIGRKHTVEQTLAAYEAARDVGFSLINMDLIAGLPGESLDDFQKTLTQIIRLAPENVTVHSLAVKRTSRLYEQDANFHYRQGEIVTQMLQLAQQMLAEAGYGPYYLYRQKHMSGSLENTGYAKPGTDSYYNARIMDEHQTITALGAGGISKVYFPAENRLERVPNVTNYEIYIERIDEMIQRKVENWNWRK